MMTMTSRKTSLLVLVVVTGVTVQSVGGYVEKVQEWGCHTKDIKLTCRDLNAQIAILEAFFMSNTTAANISCTAVADSRTTSEYPTSLTVEGDSENVTSITSTTSYLRAVREAAISNELQEQIRLPVKHRCAGVNHCSFRLTTDYTAAEEWGPGVVFISYACINYEHITRKCRKEIVVKKEGYVETPGYPQFSVETNCSWNLTAPPGQRVQLTLLDISLRGIGSMETECTDILKVTEDDRELLSMCGEKEEPIVIQSTGRSLDVTFTVRSRKVFPKRGVLFHYKALGCPPLTTPKDGYEVDRNESEAHYMCCVGFVFPDTMRRERSLHCENENTWSMDLPDCMNVSTSVWSRNNSIIRITDSESNLTTEVAAVVKETDFIYDIMLPTMIICVLLTGNGVIIFVIFYLRKRRKLAQQADDEELGAIFQPHDGSISDKAISV